MDTCVSMKVLHDANTIGVSRKPQQENGSIRRMSKCAYRVVHRNNRGLACLIEAVYYFHGRLLR